MFFQIMCGKYKFKDIILKQYNLNNEISTLFDAQIEFLCCEFIEDDIILQDIKCIFKISDHEKVTSGIVKNLEVSFSHYNSDDQEVFHIKINITSPLYLLTLTNNSEIFEKKSSNDIILKILSNHNIANNINIKNTKKHDICIQYNESDFNFLSRLVMMENLFFYDEFSQSKHKTHIVHDHLDGKIEENIEFDKNEFDFLTPCVYYIGKKNFPVRKKIEFVTCDYKNPTKLLSESEIGKDKTAYGDNIFHLEEDILSDDLGSCIKNKANIHFDRSQSYKTKYILKTYAYNIRLGSVFTLNNCPCKKFNNDYFVIKSDETLTFDAVGNFDYQHNIECSKKNDIYIKDIPYNKLNIPIFQTAIVSGENKKKVNLDLDGKIKVKFSNWISTDSEIAVRYAMPFVSHDGAIVKYPTVGSEVLLFWSKAAGEFIASGGLFNGDIKDIIDSSDDFLIHFFEKADNRIKFSNGECNISSNNDININTKKNCSIDSADYSVNAKKNLVLKCGGGNMKINPGGVTLKGPMIKLN